ncbi:MAG: gas vesicle protein GvpN, partial [Oculatellaceae cyanobacterium Prado106]|nr:gas vesicle protein GvpN [Oculatellaceae cyanobacterium Prado106]
MTTVLRANPRQFVSTPAIERVAARALRYLQSGFSVHLRGPAGTGKTTLALHLADLLTRPIMLMFGDDEFKTSDLIGNQTGYTRKKVVDNFIHSVVKVEDELRQNWVDSRLTLACREGFTLVYDEFNRSRPEVNNVLLSALEEKLLVLPPNQDRSEYVRVSPNFRAIFTSNPEEYCGVHSTQDALMDRLITIHIPEPDELTQQEIMVQKVGVDRESALTIVQIVKSFRQRTQAEKSSGLRTCLMLAKICHEHEIRVAPENIEFREVCQDLLLSRTALAVDEATRVFWDLLNERIASATLPPALSSRFSTVQVADGAIADFSPLSQLATATDEVDHFPLEPLSKSSAQTSTAVISEPIAVIHPNLVTAEAEPDLLSVDFLPSELPEPDSTPTDFLLPTLVEITSDLQD